VNPALVCEKGSLQEEDIARRWWALSPGACLPLSNGDNCRLLFAGRAGGTHGPDVRDAVLCFTSGSFAATCAAGQDSVGDVEIHIRTSDWFAHQHHTDVRYNNVILHVVAICDDTRPTLRQDGTAIPTCSLYDLPHTTPQPVEWPCHHVMVQMNEEQQARLFRLAGMLRFEQKMHAFLALLRDAQPSGCFSAPDVCLIPALAEGLGYGRDRAFFRAAGLHLLGLANTIPEPLGRTPEPSPLDAGRLRILHNLVAQWRTTGAWQTLRQALLPTPLEEAEGDRKGPHVQLERDADPDFIVEEAEGDRKGPHPTPPYSRPYYDERAIIRSMRRDEHVSSQAHTLQKLRSIFDGLGRARADILICNIVLPFAAGVAQSENDTLLAGQAQNLYRAYPALPSNQVTRAMCKQLMLKREPQGACQQQGLHFIYAQTCREKRCSQCIIGSKIGI